MRQHEVTTYIGHNGSASNHPGRHACCAILPLLLLALFQDLGISQPEPF